jgi:hypothetical protein
MRAALKWMHSPDLLDLQTQGPEDRESFCILLQLTIHVVTWILTTGDGSGIVLKLRRHRRRAPMALPRRAF